MKRHTRSIVLFAISFACVVVNAWLLMTGHYRLPLLVFVLCLVGVPLILKKLPPTRANGPEIQHKQLKAARGLRRLGWIYIAGLIVSTFNFLSGGAKEIPLWVVVMAYGWSAFLIWGCFWMAKRFNQAASRTGKPLIENPPRNKLS